MKKIVSLLFLTMLLITGCGKSGTENVINDFTAKVNDAKSYNLKGNLEIYADEETFTYSIEVDFLKDNFYKAQMVNQTNNHEQIILRNNDAVYVITPSLNKSFKFQSEWPTNSSQVYLLNPIVTDMKNDSNATTEEVDGNYVVQTTVNYPNNPELKYQKITIDKDNNIKKNEVYDENDQLKMKMTFTAIDYNASLKEEDFNLEQYIQDNEENTEDNCTDETCKQQEETCENNECQTEETGALENILYPLYVPTNTYLSSSDKVSTDNGDRVILTFGGDKNFVLVEEKASVAEEFEIIPVYGDPLIVNSTIGALSTNSLSWTQDNVTYYLAGNDLTTSELLTIGKSIGYNNTTVSKEK